jgi:hypothetical protein
MNYIFSGIITIFLTFMCSPADAANTIVCGFDKSYVINLSNGSHEAVSQWKVMKIVNNTTTDDTLKMDGSKRATNSHNWKVLKNPNTNNSTQINMAGDFGDSLTILLEKKNKLKGNIATLSYSYAVYSITFVGECKVM